MQKFSSKTVVCALCAALSLATVGCDQIALLQARGTFREANGFYQAQNYPVAAERYLETIETCRGTSPDCTDPDLDAAYFFLGNSYDNQFRPARRGESDNDKLLTDAITNYKKAVELEQEVALKKLAMEYLVAAYGPDKLNQPAEAEPILRQMIELDPTEPSNYTYLSRIYEDSGLYEEAEQLLVTARDRRPTDSGVYVTLAAYYNRQGEFDKTMENLHTRAEREPSNPEAFYTIATYYWEKAYRDSATPEPDKMRFVLAGLEAIDTAIELNPDYYEALTYKGLLLRVQANLDKNPAVQQKLLAEAEVYQNRAEEVRDKQRAAGAAGQ
jgi:cytochrome c-type biogenesis protein CcmH/NrfG